MARLVRAATDRNPPTLGGGGCQRPHTAALHTGNGNNGRRQDAVRAALRFRGRQGSLLAFPDTVGRDALVQRVQCQKVPAGTGGARSHLHTARQLPRLDLLHSQAEKRRPFFAPTGAKNCLPPGKFWLRPLPPRETPRPSGTPGTHKRLRRGGGFFAANTDFETLWSAYPRKEAKEAARALWHQLWRRGRIPGQAVLMAALASFRASDAWNREGGRYVPQLVNWLRGQRWLDEAEGSPAKEENARVREEAARQTARLEEAEMRRKAAHEREAEKLRPAFEKFLACFPEGTENHGPAWGLWNLLHSKGQAPSAADVSDVSLSPFAFLNQWRMTHGCAR